MSARSSLAVAVLMLNLASTKAVAHTPPAAWLSVPTGVGDVVDASYTIAWVDLDEPSATSTEISRPRTRMASDGIINACDTDLRRTEVRA